MNTGTFIAKNALRNKRRAALTILSVAVSCALLVTLLTLQRELTIPPESEAASLRVILGRGGTWRARQLFVGGRLSSHFGRRHSEWRSVLAEAG